MTLTDFLLARIAEDEGAARETQRYEDDIYETLGWWDPSRVLAECEAKRRMVEEATHPQTSSQEGYDMLRFLAEVYANHSDYREEWRPRLIDECDRHRPIGPNGKHDDRHTPTCGCLDKGGRR